MNVMKPLVTFLFLLGLTYSSSAAPSPELLSKTAEGIQSLVDSGKLVGAQLAIGHEDQILLNRNYGVRSIEDDTLVDSETLFCIGSCSKPIASAVVMTLVDDGILVLDRSIDVWLSGFSSLETDSGVYS